jgi:hypothetical protein
MERKGKEGKRKERKGKGKDRKGGKERRGNERARTESEWEEGITYCSRGIKTQVCKRKRTASVV